MCLICSYFFERSFQQEPVVQHAGFPSEVDSGESENAPDCQEQSGIPATAGVSCLYSFVCGLCLPDAQNCCWITRWVPSCSLSVTPVVSVSLLPPQPGGAAGQRPADWLLPPLPWLLHSDHLTAGHQGHRAPGVGFHLPLLPLQVPVEAHGEGHEQYLQVRNKMGVRLCGGFTGKSFFNVVEINTSFLPTVYTAHCWHIRKSTSASLQQRASLFWWGRWVIRMWADAKLEGVPSFLVPQW